MNWAVDEAVETGSTEESVVDDASSPDALGVVRNLPAGAARRAGGLAEELEPPGYPRT
jgi:hypothetical protein